jgi:ubiquinone/menaquinone biosynthesis C-methylase UbiE
MVGGLAILVLVLGGTFLWHLFLGVPYVPTPQKVVEKMVEMADLRPGDVVIDLGAGDGRFLLEAKKRCPDITAIGYELVPAVWLSGWLKTRRVDPSIQFRLGDARKVDVSPATVVFLYVAPHLMSILEKRIRNIRRYNKQQKPQENNYFFIHKLQIIANERFGLLQFLRQKVRIRHFCLP